MCMCVCSYVWDSEYFVWRGGHEEILCRTLIQNPIGRVWSGEYMWHVSHHGRVVPVLITDTSADLEHPVKALLQLLPVTDSIVTQHQVQGCEWDRGDDTGHQGTMYVQKPSGQECSVVEISNYLFHTCNCSVVLFRPALNSGFSSMMCSNEVMASPYWPILTNTVPMFCKILSLKGRRLGRTWSLLHLEVKGQGAWVEGEWVWFTECLRLYYT